jgi:uncharacterized protein YndB with AHSA1/START domain
MDDADRKTPHIEVTIASPPDAVWHALATRTRSASGTAGTPASWTARSI